MPIVGYSRASSFSPLSLGWAHAYWAEGPEFAALGLSNGAAVGTWPDEIGTGDLVQSTGSLKPTFQTAGTIGSQPSVRGDGTQYYRDTGAFTAMGQPYSSVVIARLTSVAGTWATVIDGTWNNRGWIAVRNNGALAWNIYAGAALAQAGTPAANTSYLLTALFSNTSSVLDVNGTNVVASGTAIGSHVRSGVSLFNSSAQLGAPAAVAGDIAFVGLFPGDARTDAKWSQFKTWVTSHYGITVA